MTVSEVAEQQALVTVAKRIELQGLSVGASGNISVRVAGGCLITPTGLAPSELSTEKIVRIDLAGEVTGGVLIPSSEWRFHTTVYAQRPDIGAVVHVHSPYATALACNRRSIPAFHYMVAIAGGDSIRCAPYATFGSQALADAAAKALQDRQACLLANHGAISIAADLEQAFGIAVWVEELARHYLLALQVGDPVLLNEAEMRDVLRRFASYGQQSDN